MYIYKHQPFNVFSLQFTPGDLWTRTWLLHWVVTTTHRCLHPYRTYWDGSNRDTSLKLLTQNYVNKNWGKFMYLIQNKKVQTHVSLFYYYFRFLPGWLISDHKPHVFVCSAAASCWLPILQTPSGTTTGETCQSQPTPMSLKKCLFLNLHYLLSSSLFSFFFCPTPPCSALLPSKQIGWGDRYRMSTFLCPGHTCCSPCPFFVPCLAL